MARLGKLLGRMAEYDVTAADIAKWLTRIDADGNTVARSTQYVHDRTCGRRAWTIDDALIICDRLDILHSDLLMYFAPKAVQQQGITPAERAQANIRRLRTAGQAT